MGKQWDENSDEWGPTFFNIIKLYKYLEQSVTSMRIYLLMELNKQLI